MGVVVRLPVAVAVGLFIGLAVLVTAGLEVLSVGSVVGAIGLNVGF